MKVKLAMLAGVMVFPAIVPQSATAQPDPIPTVRGATEVVLEDGSHQITLPRAGQPTPNRPTLAKLSAQAKGKGRSLQQELESYAREFAAANPAEVADQPDGPAYYPPIKIDGIPIEELVDLGQIAKGEGISHEEAIDRYAWQTKLQEVSNRLEAAFPDDFSGVSMLERGRKARIGFKGQIPQLAIDLAKTLPAEVELRGNKGFSQRELREALEA